MVNTRTHNRIPCDALGFLQLGETRLALQTINVSRNGACLRLHHESWDAIEEAESISGRLILGGEDFNFTARICWSFREDPEPLGSQKIYIRFGVEFTEWDEVVMESVLESLSIVTEEPPDNSFNL